MNNEIRKDLLKDLKALLEKYNIQEIRITDDCTYRELLLVSDEEDIVLCGGIYNVSISTEDL